MSSPAPDFCGMLERRAVGFALASKIGTADRHLFRGHRMLLSPGNMLGNLKESSPCVEQRYLSMMRGPDTFDRLVRGQGYQNRSEAFRDLLRGALGEDRFHEGTAKHCVGALSYVYNHHDRQLSRRLMSLQHEHHDVTVSTMHAHLDHGNCIETVIPRGPTEAVVQFAQTLMAQSGVRHGKFYPIPIDAATSGSKQHRHVHPRPYT
jgi:CopG family nickel-responsive transcriptional regulator